MARYLDQYDVGAEEQAAAAARLGIERGKRDNQWRLRAHLRAEGIIDPYPWLDSDLFSNAIRNEQTGCLEWQRALSTRGYGKVRRNGKVMYAHRLSLELKLGRPLGDGMWARHTCDNRKCIEPTHLVEGTPAENTHDMIQRGRAVWQRAES